MFPSSGRMFQIRFLFFLGAVEVDDSAGFCWRKKKHHVIGVTSPLVHLQKFSLLSCQSSLFVIHVNLQDL